MFLKFETSSKVASKGFEAFIHKIGINSHNQSGKFTSIERKFKYFLYFIIDDNCQYWKNLDEMILSSPNYPKWYKADGTGCEWLISAPKGFIIALEFNHFELVSNLLVVGDLV